MSDLDAELAALLEDANEHVRHYPVVEHSWTVGEDDLDGPGHERVVCGCEHKFGYTFGEGIHV